MTTLIDRAVSAAFGAFQRIDGRAVTYQRGQQAVQLTAVVDSMRRADAASGKIVRYEAAFAFRAEDLKFDGVALTPQNTDRIVMGDRTFEVVEGDNNCSWDVDEAGRQIVSVMAQQII